MCHYVSHSVHLNVERKEEKKRTSINNKFTWIAFAPIFNEKKNSVRYSMDSLRVRDQSRTINVLYLSIEINKLIIIIFDHIIKRIKTTISLSVTVN